MPISKDNVRVALTIRKKQYEALEIVSKKMGIPKTAVINFALYDFVTTKFPEVEYEEEKKQK